MCGIAGEIRFDSKPVNESDLIRMRDTMVHRGPDGEGHYISPKKEVGLAHRRLALIDLSESANQPMSSPDGQVWVTFNGEIYNHAELRKELEALGHKQWKTDHSDTEVIVHSYRQWGLDCLQKFRGMFAFALWDERLKRLFIARDRMGIKPLYFYRDDKRFLFASEIKAILAQPNVRREVNEESLFHFLTYAVTPAPNTMFAGIHKLPTAHFMVVDLKGAGSPLRFWDALDHQVNLANQSESQIAEMVLHELETSIRLHKAADVPVGVFLSGGVDSSANTLLFSKDENRPVDTFTIDYTSQASGHLSEAGFARKIAEMVKAKPHFRSLSEEDLIEFLPDMVRFQDEPSADPVCVPTYYVSKLARDSGIKVCQVGEGADELFCGYPNWILHYQIDRWKQRLPARSLRELALWGFRLMGKRETFTYSVLERAFHDNLQFASGLEAFRDMHKMKILSSRLRSKFAGFSSQDVVGPIRRSFLDKANDTSIVQWMAYADLHLRLPELLLSRVDKMGMGVSIESRVPYLDHKFVELAMSIPGKVKVRNGRPKHILKQALRNVVPGDILDRKKQGFSVPLEDWFLLKLGPLMRRELEQLCRETDYFDWTEVEALFTQNKSLQCWFLFNFALWWRKWIASSNHNQVQPSNEAGIHWKKSGS